MIKKLSKKHLIQLLILAGLNGGILPSFAESNSNWLKKDTNTRFDTFRLFQRRLASSYSDAAHLFSFQFVYPLSRFRSFWKKNQDGHSSDSVTVLHSLQYSFYVSRFLPKNISQYIGRFGIQFYADWLIQQGQLIKPSELSPFSLSMMGVWDFTYLPYITPRVSFGVAYINPLQKNTLSFEQFFTTHVATKNIKTLYVLSLQLLFSFDILDSYFSLKMQNEYQIRDMGLFVEYKEYARVTDDLLKQPLEKGFTTGLFTLF